MKQQLFISGEPISYSLQRKNIEGVLGKAYIYKQPSAEEVLRIVYRGLLRTNGLTESEFVAAYNTGTVWMSRKKGQYTVWMIYALLQGRIREINQEYR